MRWWILAGLVAGTGWALLGRDRLAPTGTVVAESTSRRAAEVRDEDIAFYAVRAARDPYGARDRAMLAALYLERGRATGAEADLAAAERLARASTTTRRAHNEAAASVLAGTLVAQHRFAEAYTIMAAVLARDSGDAVVRATLGEIALELGRYEEADRLFGPLRLAALAAGVGPRYARWLELRGESGAARRLLEELRAAQAEGFRVSPEQLAWYDLRLGDLAARHGRPDLAEAAYRRGLTVAPGDPRLLAARGRLALERGATTEARRLGEETLALRYDPAALMLLAEVAEQEGDSARRADYVTAVELAVLGTASGFHRAAALFLLDRGIRVAEIRDRALADLETRRDAQGYDLAAWATYKAGDLRAAATLARAATARHVGDPALERRAAIIAWAHGGSARVAR